MVTLGDVVAALRGTVDRLPFTELADALAAAEEAHVLIEQAAAGSGQDEFYEVRGANPEGCDDLDRVPLQPYRGWRAPTGRDV
jgi:hypothetical protein